jgi:hypothetical protein
VRLGQLVEGAFMSDYLDRPENAELAKWLADFAKTEQSERMRRDFARAARAEAARKAAQS